MIRVLIGTLGLLLAAMVQPAQAFTLYGWSFTVQSVGDDFDPTLGQHLGETLGSGTITVADAGTTINFNDGIEDRPAQSFAVLSIAGSFDGATITGLAADGTTGIGGFVADNTLALLDDGTSFVLAPNGHLLLSLDRPIDGVSQIAMTADNFQWGGFVDTSGGSEWQGDVALTLRPETAIPEPASVPLIGAGLVALLRARRRG